jgi:hypothetical protein
MDEIKVQTLSERIGRVERRLIALYIFVVVALIGVVVTTAVWLIRGSGRLEVRDRYECRREVAIMGYGSSHSEFKRIWRNCMAARGHADVEIMEP